MKEWKSERVIYCIPINLWLKRFRYDLSFCRNFHQNFLNYIIELVERSSPLVGMEESLLTYLKITIYHDSSIGEWMSTIK